jgi:hypothetical protein
MVKFEEVVGGSVQFHFNLSDTLHKVVVIAQGITTVYGEDDILAMLKVWNHLGETLESDRMAVDLVNGIMSKETIDGEDYMVYESGARQAKCNTRTKELS